MAANCSCFSYYLRDRLYFYMKELEDDLKHVFHIIKPWYFTCVYNNSFYNQEIMNRHAYLLSDWNMDRELQDRNVFYPMYIRSSMSRKVAMYTYSRNIHRLIMLGYDDLAWLCEQNNIKLDKCDAGDYTITKKMYAIENLISNRP